MAAALSITTYATTTEYVFSAKRCTEKQASGTYKFGKASLCDDSCTGTDDDEVGCSWSYPSDDPLGKKSDDAACRCNPEKYRWGTHVKDAAKKCNGECSEGVDCKNSWPYYAYKAPKGVRQNRCYEPPHYNGNVYVSNSNQHPVDNPDGIWVADTAEISYLGGSYWNRRIDTYFNPANGTRDVLMTSTPVH